MEQLNAVLHEISGLVWGAPLLVLLVGTGIFLTFRLRLLQVRRLITGFRTTFSRAQSQDEAEGDISHFEALMTALAATIGTGNIVGVSTAVVAGGPGAIFWMWMSAFFGMATKYAEAILAVRYREKNSVGVMAGGPMYYIKNGIKKTWLAKSFALFGAVAAFGIGNLVQSNSITMAVVGDIHCEETYVGFALMVLTAAVILGGIKSIGKVAGVLVPVMAVSYIICGLVIILTHLGEVPGVISLIISDAFTGQAVAGGAIGTVMRYGVARGVFSNEAGLGSAPIAAAAAKTDMPGRQALVSMLGTFIDTIMVCSITGIVVVMSKLWQSGEINGVDLTGKAFESFLPGYGDGLVDIGLMLFAFSTILGWCYYGEKCIEYLLGEKVVKPYRVIYALVVFVGSISSLNLVWNIADIFNGLMAIPNLIALVVLSGVVVAESDIFEAKLDEEKLEGNTALASSK